MTKTMVKGRRASRVGKVATKGAAKRRAAPRTTELGQELIGAMKEIIAYDRGERTDLRVDRVPLTARHVTAAPAPALSGAAVARIRAELQLSQSVFARVLNVSPETVRGWEQGKKPPSGPALRLLEIAQRHPQVILQTVQRRG